MGNNITTKAVASGEKYTSFTSERYIIVEKNTEDGILLNSTNDSLNLFIYLLAKCCQGAFETMEGNQIHSFYPTEKIEEDDEEEDILRAEREIEDWVDEQRKVDIPAYCHRDKEMVKGINVSFVLKTLVFMHLANVVINVYAKIVGLVQRWNYC